MKHQIEQSPLGATATTTLVVEEALRATTSNHHPLPLAVAVQFYPGDQGAAMRLVRFIADLEPVPRDDVMLIFAARFDVDMTMANVQLWEAIHYCSGKFPVAPIQSQRRLSGYPDGCYGLWAGTLDACYARYSNTWSYSSVFCVEPDGMPLRWDWIDTVKRAHARSLAEGKRVTGRRMEAGPCCPEHVSGTLVMEMSCWADSKSLHMCPPGMVWDCFHASALLRELGTSSPVINLYGAEDISPSVFATLGRYHAWLANVKDESAWWCARMLLKKEVAQETAPNHAQYYTVEEPEEKASEPVVTDLVLTTFPPDYDWLPYLFRSLDRVTGYRNLLVLLEGSYPVPAGLPKNAKVILKKDYAPGAESGKAAAIERLGVHQRSDAQAFVFVDSDCVFTRPVDIQTDPTINITRPVVLWRPWEEAGAAQCWKQKTANLLDYEPTRETMCRYPFQFPRSVMEAFWAFVGGAERMWATDFTDWNAIGNFALDKMPEAVTAVAWSNHGAASIRQFWSHHRADHPEVQRELRALGLL